MYSIFAKNDKQLINDKKYRFKIIRRFSIARIFIVAGLILYGIGFITTSILSFIAGKLFAPTNIYIFFLLLICLLLFNINILVIKYIDFKEEANDKT